MNQCNYPPFHLTINENGVVSLWDKEEFAKVGKEEGEQYIRFELTPDQVKILKAAQIVAYKAVQESKQKRAK